MSLPIPVLDDRRFEDLVRDARERIVARCPAWTDFNPSDPGITLLELMAWLTDLTLYRVNRIPERSYAVFLDMMGVRLRPAEAARTWLLFRPRLQRGGAADEVPTPGAAPLEAGTAAQARREGGPPLVFSTLEPLNLTPVRPTTVLFTEGEAPAVRPDVGEADDFLLPTLVRGKPMRLAADGQRADHILFLGQRGHEDLDRQGIVKAAPLGGLLHLDLGLATRAQRGVAVEWERFAGDRMEGSGPDPALAGWRPWIPESDGTAGLRQGGRITFRITEPMSAQRVSDGAIWLRARLLRGQADQLPQLTSLTYRFELPEATSEPPERLCRRTPQQVVSEQPLPKPGAAGARGVEVEPFGAEPAPEAALLVGSPLFDRPATEISVAFVLRNEGSVPGAPPPELRWEMHLADGSWARLGRSTPDGVREPSGGGGAAGRSRFTDGTAALTRSGTVVFRPPEGIAPFVGPGSERGWFLRVRLVSGTPHRVFITDIRVSFTDLPAGFDLVLAENYGERVPLDRQLAAGEPVRPFEVRRGDETAPAVLIGFSGKPANGLQHLLLDLHPPEKSALAAAAQELRLFFAAEAGTAARRTAWHYSCGTAEGGWKALSLARDGTRDLSARGTVSFVAPADWEAAELAHGRAHWLRVQIDPALPPEERPALAAVATNCVEAAHAEPVEDRILPTPLTREKWQRIDLPVSPALPGLVLAIREIDAPTEDDLTSLRREGVVLLEGGPGAARSGGAWVVWEEVPGFFQSGKDSRHYMVDYAAGTVTFGDGRHGRIPPAGSNRVKLVRLLRGGGSAGNVAARTVDQLVKPHPRVDRVSNPLPAEGGVDAELVEDALLRGPFALRHRERAVTAEDYERLACEASRGVARAACIGRGGLVQVLVIPKDEGETPYPGRHLVEQVQHYLEPRRPIGTRVRITGPDYVQVEARIRVGLLPAHAARMGIVREAIRKALRDFVHPVRGGPDVVARGGPGAARGGARGRSGWPLGRSLHLSELYYVVEQVEGVDFAQIRLNLPGEETPRDKIALAPTALPHLARITIEQAA